MHTSIRLSDGETNGENKNLLLTLMTFECSENLKAFTRSRNDDSNHVSLFLKSHFRGTFERVKAHMCFYFTLAIGNIIVANKSSYK